VIRRLFVIVAGVALGAALGGCGERPQVVQYKQGQYQGKPDQRPFEGTQYNGNQQEWERAIRTRNQYQNEYKRT
jgi:hypothetical protein